MIQNGIVQRATRFRLRIRWPTRADASGRARVGCARRPLGVHGKKKKVDAAAGRATSPARGFISSRNTSRTRRVRVRQLTAWSARMDRAAAAQVRRGRGPGDGLRGSRRRGWSLELGGARGREDAATRGRNRKRRRGVPRAAAVEGVDGRYMKFRARLRRAPDCRACRHAFEACPARRLLLEHVVLGIVRLDDGLERPVLALRRRGTPRRRPPRHRIRREAAEWVREGRGTKGTKRKGGAQSPGGARTIAAQGGQDPDVLRELKKKKRIKQKGKSFYLWRGTRRVRRRRRRPRHSAARQGVRLTGARRRRVA